MNHRSGHPGGGRPSPNILLEKTARDYKAVEVCRGEGVYVVVFNGQPVNIRKLDRLRDYPGPKYIRTTFVLPGHAHALAARMNKFFNTVEFAVMKMTVGHYVHNEGIAGHDDL